MVECRGVNSFKDWEQQELLLLFLRSQATHQWIHS